MRRILAVLILIAAPVSAQVMAPIVTAAGVSPAVADANYFNATGDSLTKTLGIEVVTHTAAKWDTLAAGWSVSDAPVTTLTAGPAISTTARNSTAVVVAGVTYEVTITGTRTAGSVTVSVGGTSGTAQSAATFTTTEAITAGATTAVTFTGAGFTGTITAVSVKPYLNTIDTSAGPLVLQPAGSIRMSPGTPAQTLYNDGTAALPSIAYWSAPTTGQFRNGSTLGWSISGTQGLYLSSGQLQIPSASFFGLASGAIGSAADVQYGRVAAGVGSLKNSSTGAAEWRVYGDGTGASKYTAIRAESMQTVGNSTTLTDATATGFAKFAVASGASLGVRIRYSVKVTQTSGSEQQIETGEVFVTAINKGGTITFATPVLAATTPLVTSGTLAATVFTCVDNTDNTFTVKANSDTSLTPATFTINWYAALNSATTVTQL